MPFAQLVIGPPGAGKSTYCNGMHQFMGAIGRRCSIVNLDPANDNTSYPCALDVRDLVTLEEIMAEDTLGPNGGVLYALEELENNFEWLEEGLKELGDDYVLFDCPGQVELFTHHSSLRNIFFRISKLGYRLIVIHLVDSYSLTLPSMYISALLLSLRSMLQMDLPHINVLTKIDNLSNYSPLPFNLDFYTEVQDLNYLLPHLEAETSRLSHSKFGALNQAIIDLVQEFALVAFETLAVEDKKSMMHLLQVIDRASGYAFGPAEGANDSIWQVAVREGWGDLNISDVQERWLDAKEEYDEHERKELEEEAKAKQSHGQDDELDFQGIPDSGTKVYRKSKS
ncbi:ATP binding protein, putative [Talaromyces stipitatus ATCC 10500]|uniref:GPN-loop GTPase 2 n=1 Tax=Talaromyces stipitatus (strain ATCC 10500 / CBS 375.48 / QM 6759 / NRRL 1006) TaxID=441959 RepID=B8MRJ6_TALSN|nr:ATP binding protein, putative [Talaromyces stipitatus ATCC 10500]EED13153.1 ATP binding protein, putative [Talaromyces stipitatus ATCC 10500]